MYSLQMDSRLAKWIGGILVLLVILFAAGIRVAHPHDGLKNALGSAQSGLVVYQKNPSLTLQEKVLVKVEDPSISPLLAFVSANDGKILQVQSGTAAITVQTSQVYGKLILVIPFLGSVLSVIGF
jgi:hypothetical protein